MDFWISILNTFVIPEISNFFVVNKNLRSLRENNSYPGYIPIPPTKFTKIYSGSLGVSCF